MSDVEDHDLGFDALMAAFSELDGMSVTVGVQGTEAPELLKIAAVHEFGASMTITSKQAYFMCVKLMKIDPVADHQRFWGTYHKLVGRKLVIPERSYLRGTFDEKVGALESAAGQVIERIEAGEPVSEALAWFGSGVVTLVQRRMRAGIHPDNAPLTLANKTQAQNTPLIDSGRLLNSIRYVVDPGGAPHADG